MESPNTGLQVRRIKKGQLLFSEGEKSTAMYLLKSGTIRLFMAKGGSTVEIGVIRSGEIVGELAFLDGNPRSVSGEAVSDCELVEISAPLFKEVIGTSPEWMKILLKTIVGRLRSVNARIRQLESALGRGKGKGPYQFITLSEVIKILSSFILAVGKKQEKTEMGMEVNLEKANFYSNQIMGVPPSKVDCVIDLLATVWALKARQEKGGLKAYLQDDDFIEELIQYLHLESSDESKPKKEVSVRGYVILGMIMDEYLNQSPPGNSLESFTLDVGALRKKESAGTEKNIFKNDDVEDLLDFGYLEKVVQKSDDEVLVTIECNTFRRRFRLLKFMMSFRLLNEQKRRLAGVSK